jgi:phosphoribosyl-ATP pyrophosphohydrolase
MIIPSIDLMGGQAVQLVGGRDLEMEAGDPQAWARRFGIVGEVAVVDLDAALSKGSNAETIRRLLPLCRCRVGGGIRSVEQAIGWLDAGADSIVLGTAARPEILRELPRERVVVALDAVNDEVVVEGWRSGTGRTVLDRIAELREYAGGFLVTFVEREGRLGGTRLDAAEKIAEAAGEVRVTIAGGVTTPAEIARLDERGVYWSRSRGGLWIKGESSGAVQELLSVGVDCDRDALRFRVRQAGTGFCHRETRTCWGESEGIIGLARKLREYLADAPGESYTRRLANDPQLLGAKLREEAAELAAEGSAERVAEEAGDLIYFTLAKLAATGVPLEQVEQVLASRRKKVTRRPGNAKA